MIYSACSFMDATFSSGNFFLLCFFRACAGHFQKQICILMSFVHVHHVQKWLRYVPAQKLQLLSGKIGKAVFVVFSWMKESRTFERLSIVPKRPIDFDDFLEQICYSRNGRHVCKLLLTALRWGPTYGCMVRSYSHWGRSPHTVQWQPGLACIYASLTKSSVLQGHPQSSTPACTCDPGLKQHRHKTFLSATQHNTNLH